MREEFEFLQAPPFEERGHVLEEWVDILRRLWSGSQEPFEGKYYRFDALAFAPLPERPIPIWLGGHSNAALMRAGRLGDGWVGTHPRLEEIVNFRERIFQAATEAGRDPESIAIAAGYDVQIGRDADAGYLFGDAPSLMRILKELAEAGLGHLQVRFVPDGAADDLDGLLSQIRIFARDVVPGVR
jgi:alkanesulfonate monooxygenase SsuD/methylene tetrahydromethanopterin reductase-like flavin-dependent oxidoreductase (luciferase family)